MKSGLTTHITPTGKRSWSPHHALITTDPSELATTGDDGDTDIDLNAPPSLPPPTDPSDAGTATADLDDDIDSDSGQEVVVDGRAA